ncbi:MAG: transcriptional regulator BetI [Comamonas sp.]
MKDLKPEDPSRADGMRTRLLEATLHVVGEIGLEHLTIRKVSEHASVSVGLVHHHFGNKAQLVYQTFEFLVRRMREKMTAGRRQIADPVERLRFTCDMGFTEEVLSQGAANVWPHMWSSSAHDPQVQRLCAAFSRRLKSNFVFDFRQAGHGRPMAIVHAIEALALVHGLWIEHKVAGTLTREQVRAFFHAIIDNATGRVWRETFHRS